MRGSLTGCDVTIDSCCLYQSPLISVVCTCGRLRDEDDKYGAILHIDDDGKQSAYAECIGAFCMKYLFVCWRRKRNIYNTLRGWCLYLRVYSDGNQVYTIYSRYIYIDLFEFSLMDITGKYQRNTSNSTKNIWLQLIEPIYKSEGTYLTFACIYLQIQIPTYFRKYT